MGKEAVRRPLAHPRCCQQLSRDLTSLLVSLSLTRGPGTRAGVCPQARPAPDCRTVLCIGWGTAPKSKQLSTEVAICFCSEIWAFFQENIPRCARWDLGMSLYLGSAAAALCSECSPAHGGCSHTCGQCDPAAPVWHPPQGLGAQPAPLPSPAPAPASPAGIPSSPTIASAQLEQPMC